MFLTVWLLIIQKTQANCTIGSVNFSLRLPSQRTPLRPVEPTVFGAAKPARHWGKFRLSRTVGHYYRSFQHRNELLLNKVSCFTMKTCDFYRSDDILTNTAIRAYSLTLWKIWKYMIISTQLSNNSLISLNDVWWAPMMGLKKSEREPTFDFGCGHLGFQGPVSRKSR